MNLRFTKMQGAGNDFVVIDATRSPLALSAPQARHLGDRRFGVGADQILLIEPSGGSGFVEEGWAGGVLAIGESLRLLVDGGCPRCVITTLAQGELPETLEILRATARHNRVTAGIRLSVLTGGPLAVGDPVRWWAADPVAARAAAAPGELVS